MAEIQTELTIDAVAPSVKRSQGRSSRASHNEKPRDNARPKTELVLLAEISTRLDRVVAVLAAQGKDRNAQVAILAAANCDSAFIGTVVGMTPGAVRKLPGWRLARASEESDASENHL